jgi:diaminopimelate epimerase
MEAFPQLALHPGDGCGNRLLLVRGPELDALGIPAQELAPRVCGHEWDGLLVLGPAQGGTQELRILNRDGSDGGCCLNGLRVAARHVGGRKGRLSMAGHLVPWCEVHGGIELQLPLQLTDLAVEELRLPVLGGGEPAVVHAVRYWNPHAVVRLGEARRLLDVDASFHDFPLAALAERIRREDASFPQGANVGLLDGDGEVLQLRVEERGVGETAACGSGALAAAAAHWQAHAGDLLTLAMRGGQLLAERDGAGRLHLSGAAHVGPPKALAALLGPTPKALS